MARRKESPPASDVEQGADGTHIEAEQVETVETQIVPDDPEGTVYPNSDLAAPGAEGRTERLTALIQGNVPAAPSYTVPATIPPLVSGNEQHWADGDKALVLVGMFKATVDGVERYGYKGDIIEAPSDLIDKGVSMGALTKDY